MKRMRLLNCILMVMVVGLGSNVFAGTESQFDKKAYAKIAKKTIGRVISNNIDVDKMSADMEKLVALGVSGCKEYMGNPETPPAEVKVMKITIENADKMKSLTLDQIETQWHEGGVLKANGVDIGKFDHFDEVMCFVDTVVHPATAIICLKEYRKTKNAELLQQIQDELAEVVEHLKHLK